MSRIDHVGRRNFLQSAGWGVPAFAVAAAAGLTTRAIAQETANSPSQAAAGAGATRKLAEFVVKSQFDAVPTAARREAVRSLVNYVGCAVGGSSHKTLQCALDALAPFSGPPKASVFGRKERLDPLHAALMNGISSHVLDYDDTQLSTIIHPAGPVASVLFPLAESHSLSGAQLLHAFILGVEVECRIGKCVYPSHYEAGWHITGTAGVFGAAAAAGKVLGLDVHQMTWALGIAATQSSGFKEMFGTMCKAFHPGRAAQNGLTAALLASQDFTSTEMGIESPRGFAYVMAPARDFSVLTHGLGTNYEIVENTYKPFACGIVVHPVIDACCQLRARHQLSADMIERIEVRVHPLVLELTGKTAPQTGLEGKFSVYHAAAVSILRGSASPHEFTDEVVRDPQVVTLRERVRAVVDPTLSEEQAHLAILLRNGQKIETFIERVVGSQHNPMTDADLDKKFRNLADGILAPAATERLLKLCWSVESLPDAAQIPRESRDSV